ncbi:amino acid adenylation domain-containing protein [Pseudothauera rhizosphaerae]|uniref:Amino acid adenylation domain-containing protein n=1 Tax=Pseudothauera rhizosphaerae TaxID=2565932 RepID=A0A4S4AVV5_9RHOO|nr:amino acid adenylation domain-containing protein [Pseudothauera rhizosphaerae]THF62696.1 amino acid adenylation domain-containing protein [Pseudothauera rhizosphaerae]
MAAPRPLHRALADSAARHPERPAVIEPEGGTLSYREFDALAGRLRDRLAALGVGPGDRVGIYLRKSIDAVVAIFGILKAGAAYVPVDPDAPPARNAYIMHNCAVKAVIVEERRREQFAAEFAALGELPPLIVTEGTGGGAPLARALDAAGAARPLADADNAPGDLAYILYTSGSTGRPKGVMLSHENATSFVDWCSGLFTPGPEDRFSSHAPFHFDLSILDIHVAIEHGAALVLIPEERGKDPLHLARLIAEQRITAWYSAPSILSLIAQFGRLPEHDCSALRLVLFAGEVFPVKHLRTLCEQLPGPRYFNLYGPTETNVCTWYEVVPPVPPERTAPYPIGRVCAHLQGKVVDEKDHPVAAGQEGELCITGRGVMQGYWALPEQTAQGFLVDADGTRWYRTGDIVVEGVDGELTYRGRRDRMVKRRGYRVELGEIEAGLYRHPQIKEAAVVALPDAEAGVRITAFLASRDGQPLSLIALKRFCAEQLPLYMIPDQFSWLDALPRTSTDKTDYQRLKEVA